MKNSKFKLSMIAIFIMGSSMALFAQDGRRHERPDKDRKEWSQREDHRHHEMIPDLTEEQKTKMQDLRLAFQKETLPLKNELNEKRAQLRSLTTVESPDMKKVNKLIEDMGGIEVKLMKAHVTHQQDVRKQLTEEQRIIFDSHPMGMMGHKGRR